MSLCPEEKGSALLLGNLPTHSNLTWMHPPFLQQRPRGSVLWSYILMRTLLLECTFVEQAELGAVDRPKGHLAFWLRRSHLFLAAFCLIAPRCCLPGHTHCAGPELLMIKHALKTTLDCLSSLKSISLWLHSPDHSSFFSKIDGEDASFTILENCLQTGRCGVPLPKHPQEGVFHRLGPERCSRERAHFPHGHCCGRHQRLRGIWEKQCRSWTETSEVVPSCPRAAVHAFICHPVNINWAQPMCQSLDWVWVSSSGPHGPGHWSWEADSIPNGALGSLLQLVSWGTGRQWREQLSSLLGFCNAQQFSPRKPPLAPETLTAGEPRLSKSILFFFFSITVYRRYYFVSVSGGLSKALAFSGWGNVDRSLKQAPNEQFLLLTLQESLPGVLAEETVFLRRLNPVRTDFVTHARSSNPEQVNAGDICSGWRYSDKCKRVTMPPASSLPLQIAFPAAYLPWLQEIEAPI